MPISFCKTISSYKQMENTQCFYDLCVPYGKDEKVLRSVLDELVKLNFKTVAIEQTFDYGKITSKCGTECFPTPIDINHLHDAYRNKIKILQRITILYADANLTHAMTQSLNLKKFNIIAGQPKTDAALNHCCTIFNGDIITFGPEAGGRLLVNRKSYQIAVQRGLFFEIKYAPAIADSNNRKDMVKISQNYCVKGKSKNIILSSGAEHKFQLRGPYDIINLAFIFGLSDDQGKNAIDRSCRNLFLRAESRRLGKTIMFVKANGPLVLSNSSDEDSIIAEYDDNVLAITNSECEHNEEFRQPNKKLKLL